LTATLAAAGQGALTGTTVTIPTGNGKEKLWLVRSYQIPPDDPSYARLLNWSWTYDSAVSAAAFVANGPRGQAQQLLDQLAALQNSDGSIDFAFNVATGEGAPLFRSGTIAWVGLAAAAFDQTFGTDRYRSMEKPAANYLLSLQGANGLIRGGPDVKWVSTQHNLIAYEFLVLLGNELKESGASTEAARYRTAAAQIAAGIDTNLLVAEGSSAYFREGVEDNIQSLDVQALGAAYLLGRGEGDLGALVLAHAQSAFALHGRSIALSAEPASYNMTYSSPGPFTGFAPYLGVGAPNVLWFEGTAEMRYLDTLYGQSTTTLDESIVQWAAPTKKDSGAPLQADRTVTTPAYNAEYHVWPAAAGAAWVILSQSTPKFLSAALPSGTTLVSETGPAI
jgi:microcompartment protein CcmK/EutM